MLDVRCPRLLGIVGKTTRLDKTRSYASHDYGTCSDCMLSVHAARSCRYRQISRSVTEALICCFAGDFSLVGDFCLAGIFGSRIIAGDDLGFLSRQNSLKRFCKPMISAPVGVLIWAFIQGYFVVISVAT